MEHFKMLFNIMIDPVIIIDINGMLLEVTDKLEEITGYQKQEILSKNYLDVRIINPKSHKVITENLSRGMIITPYEVELLTKSGKKMPHEVNSARITYLGKPAHMIVFRDITARKEAEYELKESEVKYRSLIENLQDGVFLIQDKKIIFANEAFARIPGYPIEEIIGRDFRDLVAPDDIEMVEGRYIRMMAGEDVPLEVDFSGIRKDNDTLTTVHMTVSLINYLGKPAALGTVKDTTEIKRIEKALLDCNDEYRKLCNELNK
jgi:PAS domain S-box-containing protein